MNNSLSSQLYKRIGLFDSGTGGLTVLRRLARVMPQSHFVYLGDSARLPYGNRSRAEMAEYVQQISGFLGEFSLDAMVMACNTSAALAHDVAEKGAAAAGYKLFDLIAPTASHLGVQPALDHVGVLATSATARSQAFGRALKTANFNGRVSEIGCPRLVPLIESGRLGEPEIEAALGSALKEYLMKMSGAGAIVLGCSHFPFLQNRIESLLRGPLSYCFPEAVRIVDPALQLALAMTATNENELAPDMVTPGILKKENPDVRVDIYCTGDADAFREGAKRCLGEAHAHLLSSGVRQIKLSTLEEAEKERQANQITKSGSFPPVLLKPSMAPAGFFA